MKNKCKLISSSIQELKQKLNEFQKSLSNSNIAESKKIKAEIEKLFIEARNLDWKNYKVIKEIQLRSLGKHFDRQLTTDGLTQIGNNLVVYDTEGVYITTISPLFEKETKRVSQLAIRGLHPLSDGNFLTLNPNTFRDSIYLRNKELEITKEISFPNPVEHIAQTEDGRIIIQTGPTIFYTDDINKPVEQWSFMADYESDEDRKFEELNAVGNRAYVRNSNGRIKVFEGQRFRTELPDLEGQDFDVETMTDFNSDYIIAKGLYRSVEICLIDKNNNQSEVLDVDPPIIYRIHTVTVSYDKKIIIGNKNGVDIYYFDTRTRKANLINHLPAGDSELVIVKYLNDGRIVTIDTSNKMQIWDTENINETKTNEEVKKRNRWKLWKR